MPCKVIGNAIVCSRIDRAKRCHVCGRPAPILCDYPVTRDGKWATCDRQCCREHAVKQPRLGPDRDFCLAHHDFEQKKNAAEQRGNSA